MGLEQTTTLGYGTFSDRIEKDIHPINRKEDQWTYARNAVARSPKNDLYSISNEQSNYLVTAVRYYTDEDKNANIKIIGLVHIQAGEWAVFSTDEKKHEIGHFDTATGVYRTVVNSELLNFSKYHLITGVARVDSKCRKRVYWDDGVNPTRVMDIDDVPWVRKKRMDGDCVIYEDTDVLDIEKTKLAMVAPPMKISLERGTIHGEMENGAYFVAGAYIIDGQRITSYSLPSNTVYLYAHENMAGSLEITISDVDEESFDEMEIVVVQYTNMNPVCKRLGVYSTRQKKISVDRLDLQLEDVSLGDVIRNTPVIEKSDAMYRNGEYILRIGPTEKFDFNYQPLANKIRTEWVCVKYPMDYYRDGGTNVGYMRDEIYSFFIRWVYDTGDRSRAYHIPGREWDDSIDKGGYSNVSTFLDDDTNSAVISSESEDKLPDGGEVIYTGKMGYWESSEKYDDDKPEIWGDLCGKPIRHHRFPDNKLVNYFKEKEIYILGVRFSGIQQPVDNDGNLISGIIGYEIYRGNRHGNKTVLAKGVFKNMKKYDADGSTYIYQNFPFNPKKNDVFFNEGHEVLQNYYSFISPELMFRHPYLTAKSIKIDEFLKGEQRVKATIPPGTTKHKILNGASVAVAFLLGIGYSILQTKGHVRTTSKYPTIDFGGTTAGVGSGGTTFDISTGLLGPSAAEAGKQVAAVEAANLANKLVEELLTKGMMSILLTSVGVDPKTISLVAEKTSGATAGAVGGRGGSLEYEREDTAWSNLPKIIRVLAGFPLFLYYTGEGMDKILDIIYGFIKYRDHTLQLVGYSFLEDYESTKIKKTDIKDMGYLDNNMQSFGNYVINNLWRIKDTVIQTKEDLNSEGDDSPYKSFMNQKVEKLQDVKTISKEQSNDRFPYGALKQRLRNQYGQISSIQMVPICSQYMSDSTSDILFGGDTFIGRYTVKDTFMFFDQWLTTEPDGTGFDYSMHMNIPNVRYYADTNRFQISDLLDDYQYDSSGSEEFNLDLWEENSDAEGNCDCENLDKCLEDTTAERYREKYCKLQKEYYNLLFYENYAKTRLCVDHISDKKGGNKYGCNNMKAQGEDEDIYSEEEFFFAQGTYYEQDGPLMEEIQVYVKDGDDYTPYTLGIDDFYRVTIYLEDDTLDGALKAQVAGVYRRHNSSITSYSYWNPVKDATKAYYIKDENGEYSLLDKILFKHTIDSLRYYDDMSEYDEQYKYDFKTDGNNYTEETIDFLDSMAKKYGFTEEGTTSGTKERYDMYIIKYILTVLYSRAKFGTDFYKLNPVAVSKYYNKKYSELSEEEKQDILSFALNEDSCKTLFEIEYPDKKKDRKLLDKYSKSKGKFYKRMKKIEEDASNKLDSMNSIEQEYITGTVEDSSDTSDNTSIKEILQNFRSAGNDHLWPGNDIDGDKFLKSLKKTIGSFVQKNSFFFLGSSTVLDFFVESDYNVDFRDYGDGEGERFYDHRGYTYLNDMFTHQNMTKGNFMKYDMSYSVTKNPYQFIPWAITQDIDYDPNVSEKCYMYKPNRIVYSLPQKIEGKKDNWRVFLPNNYKEFTSRPTSVKPYGKYAAMITFESESPAYFEAFDELSTSAGVKINIGDGGLFSRPTAHMSSAESANEYGSCQDSRSVVNTPVGVFYVSQNQGKIFEANYGDGLKEPSLFGLNSWLYHFLPYKLLEDKQVFVNQEFELINNPVAGIGCQTIYDNNSHIVYFCKKDYRLKKEFVDDVLYIGKDDFAFKEGSYRFKLGDPQYFDDASWTLSFNPIAKIGQFLSWHDWHPDLSIPTKDTFMTVKDNGIWIHNDNCQSYCNFYGKDYPFEIEYEVLGENMSVETLRNICYVMEAYVYDENCEDRFHVLDENFDRAVIYNSEQCSGLLHLYIKPKDDPWGANEYPKINDASVDVLVSKEEQIYRFNQFFDLTDDRGEFEAEDGSKRERVIFNTEQNGYVRSLNQTNINYDKNELEHKKFRHFREKVLLIKTKSGNKNIVLAMGLMKRLNSSR